jgi:predicted metalloprotease with PDZ domain
MRGVDLSIFEFDYDMQWQALLVTPHGNVLGRFGGRDADTPAKYHSLAGLNHALKAALERFKFLKEEPRLQRNPVRPEDYPAAVKRPDNACIHCHHVVEFRRDQMQREKRWSLDNVWVYPQPENLGLSLDVEQGDRVVAVEPKSLAANAGITTKARLTSINDTPIASVADVQYALHKAPKSGELRIDWRNDDTLHKATAALARDWRKTDVSWRWSLKSMSPNPSIIGDDLDADGRKALGLNSKQLAYRHMNFLTPAARFAGLQANDVIVGVNDKEMSMTARQFEAHLRLYHRVGEEIALNVVRGKERVKVKLKLPE